LYMLEWKTSLHPDCLICEKWIWTSHRSNSSLMKAISLQQYIKHVQDNNTALCHFTMWSSGTITSKLPLLQLQECHELGNCFNPSMRCVSFSLLQTKAPEIPVSTCTTLSNQLTLCQSPIGEVKL
jgi:hypothetical protein